MMMKMGMSMNAQVSIPTLKLSNSPTEQEALFRQAAVFSSSRTATTTLINQKSIQRKRLFVVQAKGKGGRMSQYRQPQRSMPVMPKIEDDGNPRFVFFIRMANLYLWYPVSIVAGGTTAKILVASKDNFLGKYIYKDTMTRNLAAVIYRDEEEVQETAKKMHRVLQNATEFRYGYKLVENGNIRSALVPKDVIELPLQGSDELKTVLEKVKDYFEDVKESAKESFGQLMSLGSSTPSTTSTPSTPSKKKRSRRRTGKKN